MRVSALWMDVKDTVPFLCISHRALGDTSIKAVLSQMTNTRTLVCPAAGPAWKVGAAGTGGFSSLSAAVLEVRQPRSSCKISKKQACHL